MDFKTENKYTVFFKDGSCFESSGSADRIDKSTVDNEFKWVSFHIQKEIRMAGKELSDVKKIEYTLQYIDP